jgi:hypothetical protein
MSADACVVYFGLRFEVTSGEVEALELRRDPRQVAARGAGLTTYWGNFGGPAEHYVLLVGTKIAIVGPENEASARHSADDLAAIIAVTTSHLREAGLEGEPCLHIGWQEDA